MAVSRGFQDFILDLLGPLDPVARRMFSGVGLFHGGVMFGLVAGFGIPTLPFFLAAPGAFVRDLDSLLDVFASASAVLNIRTVKYVLNWPHSGGSMSRSIMPASFPSRNFSS